MQTEPLILTLKLDEESQAFFNAQRVKYFPSKRNYLDAHLVLFYQLPAKPATFEFFKGFTHETFILRVTGLINLGAGVAYGVESAILFALQKLISKKFHDILLPQDLQSFRPHITVMNKSTAENARALMTELYKDFQPFIVTAIGLELSTYLGGPWRHEQTFLFV